jgi:hypothetical protein
MNQTIAQFGMLIPIAVQWLRAQKKVPEWATWAITACVGLACYGLYADGNWQTREFWQHAGLWVLMAMGVNQGASSLANAGIAVIPRTNSQ